MLQVALRRSRGKNCLSSVTLSLETVRVSKLRKGHYYIQATKSSRRLKPNFPQLGVKLEKTDFERAERKEVKNRRKLVVAEIVVADFDDEDPLVFSAGLMRPPTDRGSLQVWGKRLKNWHQPEWLVQSLGLRPIDLE